MSDLDRPEKEKPQPDEEFRETELASDMNVAQVHGAIIREKDEPRDGYEPVPLWLIALFMGIVFWGGLYIANFSGGYEANVYDAGLVDWTGQSGGADKGPVDPLVLGKRVYTANCVACHQTTGLGLPGQFPPLVGSEWVLNGDWHGDNHLIMILLHGLGGPIQVMGDTYNGAMPPWRDVLNDEKIAAVLSYIRNEWGNEAPNITPEQVLQIREETAQRTSPYTQAELKAIDAVVFDALEPAPAEEEAEGTPGEPAPEGEAPAEGTSPAAATQSTPPAPEARDDSTPPAPEAAAESTPTPEA